MRQEPLITYELESLRSSCPAIFADAPAPGVSDRYSFIPTHAVIAPLLKEGWRITDFKSQHTGRNGPPDPTGFHLLRLVPPGKVREVRGGRFEACLLNSHNRSRRITARAGLYRLVCKNGLMLPTGMAAETCRLHLDGQIKVGDVIDAFAAIAASYPRIADSVEVFAKRDLTLEERVEFADACLMARYGNGPRTVTSQAVLTPRRIADASDDLWTVLNRVQENIIWGCRDGRHMSKPVSSLVEQARVNVKMWELAEELMARGRN